MWIGIAFPTCDRSIIVSRISRLCSTSSSHLHHSRIYSLLFPRRLQNPSLPNILHAHAHTTPTPTRSDPASSLTLQKSDVVKLHLGAHIDGFASVTAETLVVGASPESPVTGRRADVIKAAWTAAEVAMRLVKVGNKNWQVTDAVNKVAQSWGCKPVEGVFCISDGGFGGF